ncbi:Peroxiredoxin [Algoriphagus alkaliphilus]|uniref:Peroxiredoxin n=1 Tax=Algoriphagus alkaliphilus TaxID=279824 RepID=A0A1G5WE90_9BACT|nr:peroxiredoxin family protein [Algoriphagus alkaliphilus]SDA56390.1 Peroxiredoxin [Algoriphagus alkaliphilus]
MSKISILSLLLSLLLVSCASEKSPQEVFEGAKEKVFSANRLSFNQLMLWESPELGEIDTFSMDIILRKNLDVDLGFDYLGKREGSGYNYIEGVLSSISHKDSVVTYYPEKEIPMLIQSSMYLTNSPIRLLENGPWSYLGDTAIGGKTYKEYLWIEMDTTITDKKVLLKNHIFINPSNELVDHYSRRLFHDGKKSQFIEVKYSEYDFADLGEKLAYDVPSGYLSKQWGQKEPDAAQVLKKGEKAPDFELTDEKGERVKLSEFRGKKVLLDFSMIHCGWCKIAIDQFNKPDYQFAENIIPLYVNPVDSKEKMDKYRAKVTIPFPVLINAGEVGKAYGVTGYPTFYLIDENGKVEDVVVGFSDEKILEWKKGD